MQKSILFEKQKQSGAQFVETYGWQIANVYSSIEEEYPAAKNAVVLTDRCYLGHLKITGKDHIDLLHRMTANEMRKLQPEQGQINVFTNEKGRIVDRVFLLKMTDEIQLLTSPANSEKIIAWIDKFTFIEDVKVEDITGHLGRLALFGPKASELLKTKFGLESDSLADLHFQHADWQGKNLQILRTPELAVPGFYLLAEAESLPQLWDDLLDSGAASGLIPVGETAYEVLRIEAGWPMFQKDFDEQINPHEANFLPYIDFDKGCYIGQEVVARLDTYEKVQKYLVGIILDGEEQPQKNDSIFVDEREAGYITSTAYSFSLQKNIGLGYVRSKLIADGAQILIATGHRKIPGQITKLPFKI